MPNSPKFTYYLGSDNDPVTRDRDLWRQPLPLSRHLSLQNAAESICLGGYFEGLRTFLERDRYEILCRALSTCLQRITKPEDIHEIRIRLAKHGEFYHPACLEAIAYHRKISLVLNVAVSETGIDAIGKEYQNLIKLSGEFSASFLPRVYGFGEVQTEKRRTIRMFLGQWFEGYHEFHISLDPSDKKNKILVWDETRSRLYLSMKQTVDLYRQAAGILTSYYNVGSFEQVSSWHHGAGDFVLRIDDDHLDLKLITVRDYTPLFENLPGSDNAGGKVELILQALLLFFLNLSIRMRLDRLDGVGDIVWADRVAVEGTVTGFLESLACKPCMADMPDSIERCFRYYLSVCSQADLYELSKAAVKTFNPQAPEARVVSQRLKAHVEDLNRAIEKVLKL